MAVRDWPKPAIYSVRVALISLSLAIAIVPAAWLIMVAGKSTQDQAPWLRILGGYSLVVTVPTTLACSIFCALGLKRDWDKRSITLAIMVGTAVGLVVGLVLAIVTGGYSLLSAPAVGCLTFVAVWLIRALARVRTPPRAQN
jgi:uncharacterized membrane protein YcfT